MKKTIQLLTIIFLLLSLTNCSILRNPVNGEKVIKLYKDSNGEVNITGDFTVDDLKERPSFSDWYNTEYDSYEVDAVFKEHKKEFKKLFRNRSVQIFMGTWCSDSQREVPRFMKIMDFLGVSKGQIQLVGVNRKKQAFEGQDLGKRIKRVPTFIFYQHEFADRTPTEIGRIVESPVESLEKDMLKILLGDPYVPNYANQ